MGKNSTKKREIKVHKAAQDAMLSLVKSMDAMDGSMSELCAAASEIYAHAMLFTAEGDEAKALALLNEAGLPSIRSMISELSDAKTGGAS